MRRAYFFAALGSRFPPISVSLSPFFGHFGYPSTLLLPCLPPSQAALRAPKKCSIFDPSSAANLHFLTGAFLHFITGDDTAAIWRSIQDGGSTHGSSAGTPRRGGSQSAGHLHRHPAQLAQGHRRVAPTDRQNRGNHRVREPEAENRALRKTLHGKGAVIDMLKKSVSLFSKPQRTKIGMSKPARIPPWDAAKGLRAPVFSANGCIIA